MELKKLLAIAVAAAFAVPLAAQASADGDRLILAQSGGPSGASAAGTGPSGAPASPQSAGEPKAPTAGSSSTAGSSAAGSSAAGSTTAGSSMSTSPNFSALDKNNDGQISRSEWDAYYRSGSAATGGATTAPGAVGTDACTGAPERLGARTGGREARSCGVQGSGR